MRRPLAVLGVGLAVAVLLSGCGSSAQKASTDIPAVRESRVPIDAALTDAGIGAQLVQSLSETAQSAAYARDPGDLTSWRTSQDLALVALKRCRDASAGTTTFEQDVAADVADGIDPTAATRVNQFMEQEFCPSVR